MFEDQNNILRMHRVRTFIRPSLDRRDDDLDGAEGDLTVTGKSDEQPRSTRAAFDRIIHPSPIYYPVLIHNI